MVRAATESEGTDRMMKMPRLMAAAGAALVALLIAGGALAQPAAIHTFWGLAGSVTIDGEPAPSDTRIVAWADGEQVGSGNVGANGAWSVEVGGNTDNVTFTVDDIPVEGVTRDAPAGGQTSLSLAVVTAVDPHTFSGTTTLDGEPAAGMAAADPDALEADAPMPVGATITATADGQETVSTTSDTADGSWSLKVPGDTEGWTITATLPDVDPASDGPFDAPAGESTTVNLAMMSPEPEGEPADPHRFYGTVTLDGAPAMMAAMDSDSMMMDDGDDSMMMDDGDDSMMEGGDDSMMEGGDDSMMDNGGAKAMGATITATADGQETVSTTSDTADGSWSLEVPGDTEGWTITATITVNGVTLTDSDSGLPAPAGGSTMIPFALLSPGPTEPAPEDDDSVMEGDDEDPPTVGGVIGMPDNGSGGLADGSRGVSTAVYGGIAGALALIALMGGVAIRRRSQS